MMKVQATKEQQQRGCCCTCNAKVQVVSAAADRARGQTVTATGWINTYRLDWRQLENFKVVFYEATKAEICTWTTTGFPGRFHDSYLGGA